MQRQKVRFDSGGSSCAAWYYPGSSGACVLMAAGFGVTKEPGTDRFAARFQEAGLAVLAFDYRRLGESGGEPRQVVRISDNLADWRAALAFAATLPGVAADRLAIWGFSTSGGHVVTVAAENPQVAAAVAQMPNLDGPAATRAAIRHQTPRALLRTTARSLRDALGGAFGRPPLLLPLAGEPGSIALLTTPDARVQPNPLDPDGSCPDWPQEAAARSALPLSRYRPVRDAVRVRCPILFVVCEDDRTALAEPGVRAARLAPRGELELVPGGHYAPFLEGHEQAVAAELAFFQRALMLPKPMGVG